ncbi:MAG: 2-C-methyl-D-erythritol 4-phosphate cytidylyltransferase [Acidobacteriota bacterium]|nr:2-C-methyl-D-erythritol 4-phosphate cytidylyltransferase [Acidobacteriota bacterium]
MNVAIIVAAGRGTRAGAGARPKQFRLLCGTPVLVHTLRRFEECETITRTIAVVPADSAEEFETSAREHGLVKLARVVAGGATRTESVWRGLQAINHATVRIVAVHDGVRPFVGPAEIDATVRAAEKHGAAALVAHATDTIKEVRDGLITQTYERANLRRALTPQCFRFELLRRAYERALAEGIDATDDCALVERLGATVAAVEGDARNIKLTRPEDFALAEIFLKSGVRSLESGV